MADDIRNAFVNDGINMLLAPGFRPSRAMKRDSHAAIASEFDFALEIGCLILKSGIVAVKPFGISAGIVCFQLSLVEVVDMLDILITKYDGIHRRQHDPPGDKIVDDLIAGGDQGALE